MWYRDRSWNIGRVQTESGRVETRNSWEVIVSENDVERLRVNGGISIGRYEIVGKQRERDWEIEEKC
jgi:hypothetical protein